MITVEHLTKYYGNHLAVDDLSFEISEGHVYGFLGPNGAGKSTTMNIMTGCLSATEGHVLIDGHDIFEEPLAAKKLIGYLPEQPPLYLNESPEDYLTFVGMGKGLRGQELKDQIEIVIAQTGIENVRCRRIATLSKGYKQRVGIAQALLGHPKVVILDEPTVGLDPLQIIEIRELIKELGKTVTVILSSHILSEVQSICDQIVMISKGKLVAFDSPENLEKNFASSSEIVVTTEASAQEVTELFAGEPLVTKVTIEESNGHQIKAHIATDSQDMNALSRTVFAAFASKNLPVLEMSTKKANLEDVFLELAEEKAKASDESHEEKEEEVAQE